MIYLLKANRSLRFVIFFLGDRLLPLSADVEVSDFPTLDEVQQMAIDGAQLAHGKRPEKLPSTSNTIWQLIEVDQVEVSSKF